MTVGAHFVLTNLLIGYLLPVDGLFLKYKSSLNKNTLSIQGIQNEQILRLPRDFRKLLNIKKKLVILDRKDKRVKKFLQKLYDVIEDSTAKLAVEKEEEEPKKKCYRAFGSIYNTKPNSKCIGRKPTIKVLKVNIVPVEKPFTDSTRKGSEDVSSDDVDNFEIIRIENLIARRDEGVDKNHDEQDGKVEVKTRKLGAHRFNIAKQNLNIDAAAIAEDSSDEDKVSIENTVKRFQIVKNGDEFKNTKQISIDHSNKDLDDSDEEPYRLKPHKKPQKYIVETQQATADMADGDDSEESWQKPKQKQKSKKLKKTRIAQSDDPDADDWQSQIEEENKLKDEKQKLIAFSSVEFQKSLEDIQTTTNLNRKKSKKRKQDKTGSNKYVYMQGSRFVNSDLESEETRRADRDLNIFLPKKKLWTSHEIHQLGSFWYNGPQGQFLS